ncbi:MAG: FAD:protein FMN transferase [Actinobacteria bacterium]|nr:FAD:protein FMN transferase [Actinomycetota bacterium]
MRKTAVIMGMPVVVQVIDKNAKEEDISEVFSYFHHIDNKFSTYKKDSEISLINSQKLNKNQYSKEMQKILKLSDITHQETNGYFDININGKIDPSGIVKGYAINNGANILVQKGYKNIYVEIAGDIQVFGNNGKDNFWKIGIQNPFNLEEIIKVVKLKDKGIATSGIYIRGSHIINPKKKKPAEDIVSITVIGPNVYEADRFATAAFAMGKKGIRFIEGLKGLDGYMIQKDKTAVYTSGFSNYVLN